MPPSCVSSAETLEGLHRALVAANAAAAADNAPAAAAATATAAEAAVRDAAVSFEARMRNAPSNQASRMPGGPASPARLGAAAAVPGGNGDVLRLILDAVRMLAEVNAAAVSMLLACFSHD